MFGREENQRIDLLRRTLAGIAAVAMLLVSGATMADWVFVEMTGIRGESADKVHAGAINALSWQWGMTQPGSYRLASGGSSGKVDVKDFSFSHYVDSASPGLMHYCATGRHIEEVKIFVRSPGDRPVEYLQITLKKVVVTGVAIGGAAEAGARPTEDVSLSAAEVLFEYLPQSPDGRTGGKIPFSWNVETNTPK